MRAECRLNISGLFSSLVSFRALDGSFVGWISICTRRPDHIQLSSFSPRLNAHLFTNSLKFVSFLSLKTCHFNPTLFVSLWVLLSSGFFRVENRAASANASLSFHNLSRLVRKIAPRVMRLPAPCEPFPAGSDVCDSRLRMGRALKCSPSPLAGITRAFFAVSDRSFNHERSHSFEDHRSWSSIFVPRAQWAHTRSEHFDASGRITR